MMLFRFFQKPSLNEIINLLEDSERYREAIPHITTFGVFPKSKHRNTLLLSALAWNRLDAARYLLSLDLQKTALNLADSWPTCKNSPLVLAAKIHAPIDIVKVLIGFGADVNSQDYRGFTALHYACILRNESLIKLLHTAGADFNIKNKFDKTAYDYYISEISMEDLGYRYGVEGDRLKEVYDFSPRYNATKNPSYNFLRWFLPHIIVNAGWGKNYSKSPRSDLHKLALLHISYREPVWDVAIYSKMEQCFCSHRPQQNEEILQILSNDPVQAPVNALHL